MMMGKLMFSQSNVVENPFSLMGKNTNGDHFVTPVKCAKDGFFLNGKSIKAPSQTYP